jgi:RNA polymerase sigma-70 factor, ECF subfamily
MSSASSSDFEHGFAHDFERVVVPLIGDAYRTALRFSRQRADAEDLLQDALLRALRGFSRFQPGSNARAWLRTIVHSAFVTGYRRQRRRAEINITSFDQIEDAAGAWPGAAAACASEWRVRHAFDCVPTPFREAVRLVDLDELTYEEAAATLRCPLNTLKSRVRRGRRHLAAALREAPVQRPRG